MPALSVPCSDGVSSASFNRFPAGSLSRHQCQSVDRMQQRRRRREPRRAFRETGLASVKRGVIMDEVRADAVPGLRILLVERDPIDAAALVQLMRASQGAPDVVKAASFSAVADVLRREAIDAIFCSVAAQDMKDFQTLIRTAKPRLVVALGSEAEIEVRKQATVAGAVRALCKERLLAAFVQRIVRATQAGPVRMPAYA